MTINTNHYTPQDVANVLAKHAPKNIETILEPSVGAGDLLKGILNKPGLSHTNVICIDNNKKSITNVQRSLRNSYKNKFEFVCSDFLLWYENNTSKKNTIDCIVMNPPFQGKKNSWVDVDILSGKNISTTKKVPIEVAFVYHSLSLLKDNGRLLAILPSSVISGIDAGWLRSEMLKIGSIKYVHELPRFTFKSVEARVYLLVFVKGKTSKNITMLNHELFMPEKLSLSTSNLSNNVRWDFGYYWAKQHYDDNKQNTSQTRLSDLAIITRGAKSANQSDHSILHTNRYSNCFWRTSNETVSDETHKNHIARNGDILVKRVGRNCSHTFGLLVTKQDVEVSDCIIIIRPKTFAERYKLLLVLRSAFSSKQGARLLEKGTGASYLTKADLDEIVIPEFTSTELLNLLAKYKRATMSENHTKMLQFENQYRHNFLFKGYKG